MKIKKDQIIQHRINEISSAVSKNDFAGIELDVRTFGNEIVCSHDPFIEGEYLSKMLKKYKHKKIIVNVKEDGLVSYIESRYNPNNIYDLLYLDVGTPEIETTKIYNKIFLRISEYENYSKNSYSSKFEWVWLDSFNSIWFENELIDELSKNYKVCLVSPELQIQNNESINDFKEYLKSVNYTPDFICTKYPDQWL